MSHEYKLISTGNNSEKYGNCEVCGKQCAEVFHQIEARVYVTHTGNISHTRNNCKSLFGHKDCLVSAQR